MITIIFINQNNVQYILYLEQKGRCGMIANETLSKSNVLDVTTADDRRTFNNEPNPYRILRYNRPNI